MARLAYARSDCQLSPYPTRQSACRSSVSALSSYSSQTALTVPEPWHKSLPQKPAPCRLLFRSIDPKHLHVDLSTGCILTTIVSPSMVDISRLDHFTNWLNCGAHAATRGSPKQTLEAQHEARCRQAVGFPPRRSAVPSVSAHTATVFTSRQQIWHPRLPIDSNTVSRCTPGNGILMPSD